MLTPALVKTTLSVLTVAGQLIALAVIVQVFVRKNGTWTRFIKSYGLQLMLAVALIATLGSLYFSEVALWTPCKLCWYQRILMYPQVVILGVALYLKDRMAARYILALSIIGLAIALFHYGEQVSAALFPEVVDPDVPCDITGTSCRSTPFFDFGYITIPLMAGTAFLLNILGSLVMTRKA